jgi:tetratricopeptide (TPR) repeat protein
MKDALAVHRQALALRRELAAAAGADVETRLDVARSLYEVGWMLQMTGDNAGSLATHEEQRDLAERLEAEHPTDAVRVVLAQAHNGIAIALAFTGKQAEALQAFQKALATWQKLADANPAVARHQKDVTTGHFNIGNLLTRMGKLEEGQQALQKALPILQKLTTANPAVTEFQHDLARCYGMIGWSLLKLGRPRESAEACRKALDVYQKVVEANPANTLYQELLGSLQNTIGQALGQTGKLEEAMEAQLKALATSQKLVDGNPTVTPYEGHLAESHTQLGRLLVRQKRFAEAFSHIDAGLAICQKLTKAEPENTENTSSLGYSHAYRGWALVRSGQASKAAADLRRAVELWAKEPAPDIEMRFERSRALALLAGLGGDAKSGVTKEEAAAFAGQAVAALANAVTAGWAWPGELKEPDFDALRGRADFQKLVAEVEEKARPNTKPND